MLPDADDDAPITRRIPPSSGRGAARKRAALPAPAPRPSWLVWIFYREPTYAQRSGIHETYSSRFAVRATDERAAIAQARAEFEAAAALSGVGWVRVIERVMCERAPDA